MNAQAKTKKYADLDQTSACFALGYLAGKAAREEERQRPICVTGGSGFLGSWVVKMLYDRGHVVHCTTRNPTKAAYLKKVCVPSATTTRPGGELKIFSGCDLLKDGTFDGAIKGCSAVIHTASPFFTHGGSEDNLIKPATMGTKNVLDACARLKIKRVVLTSSTAAVYAGYGKWDKDHVYTEDDWSPEDRMRRNNNFYCLSKTRAEKLAWEIAKTPGCSFKLAVMNPTLIWGPMLPGQPHFNTSCAALVGYMDGSQTEIASGTKAVVDVRDVAEAHVRAAEDISGRLTCWGRRCLLISASPLWKDVVAHIKDALPENLRKNVPETVSTTSGPQTLGAPSPHPTLFDGSRAKILLERSLIGVAEMVRSSVTSMVENGFTKKEQYIPGK